VSLPHHTILELMSLADGELRGEEKDRVEKLVTESDEARRIVESMRGGEVSLWLGPTMTERAGAAGADGIADSVMATIRAGHVVSLPGRGARRAPALRAGVAAVAATLALAAGIAAYVHSAAKRSDERAGVARTPAVDSEASSQAVLAQQGRPVEGVEVNEIDAPSRGVSVFEIPAGAAAAVASARASSVVIWVDDDPGPK
jgi:hypothetical protein